MNLCVAGGAWFVRMADGRILRPADISKMVVHLLSDDAVMQSGSIIDMHENFGLCCWDGQGSQ